MAADRWKGGIANHTPVVFAQTIDPDFVVKPHHELIDQALVKVADSAGRVIISLPPRHGKSWLCSRYFPCWYLGTHPDRRIILTSYGSDFAASWGRKCRDIMEANAKRIFDLTVSQKSSAADRWDLYKHEGGMVTAGVGGGITGKGAHCFIIDDPFSSWEEAQSQSYRDRAWDWWTGTAITRLEPGACVVIIATRWHQDDLIGRLLESHEEHWDNLVIPALAEEDDILGRKEGEALWPERYDEPYLLQRKVDMGTLKFNAEYQQRPAPAEGSRFKRDWFRTWKSIGPDAYDCGAGRVYKREQLTTFITVDLAASVKTSADWTVMGVWGRSLKNDMLLLDIVRKRMEGPDITPELRRLFDLWHPVNIAIESVGYQLALIQEARRDGLPITQLKADKDKIARALTAEARMEGGNIYWEAGAWYQDKLEEELIYFPNGKNDDMVDMLCYAAVELAKASNWATAYGMVRCENERCIRMYRKEYQRCPHCSTPNADYAKASGA